MMQKYAEYCVSQAEWLSVLPSHWECKKIGSLFTERKVKVSDKDYAPLSVTKMGILPQLEHAAKTNDGDNRKLVCAGDFVINSRSDRKGSCGVSDLDGSVSLINLVLTPRGQWNHRYVHYLLRSQPFSEEYYRNGRGIVADLWTTRYSEMKSILLPIPARDEQDQIVRFLDWKVSSINKLMNIKRKEIAELNESLDTKLRDVLLSVPNVKEVPLKRICSVPMTDGPHETPIFVDSGIPFVSAEASHDGRIHLDECRGFITREQHEVYCQKVRPHKNDIFIVKSGSTTGKTVMVDFDEEFSIWSPLALVRCNNLAIPRYVFFYCTSVMFQKQVRDNWSFGTQPNIGMGVLENLRLPLPEIEEQRAIVDTLDAYWSKVLQVKCNLKKQIEEL
jgi:type I restriction enzyme, S subunit